ncbi:hypothetical protein [Mixta theicola]|nr:hypothetical protein [Mixta theicola]
MRRADIGTLMLMHSVNSPQYARTRFSQNSLEQDCNPASELNA